MWKIVFTLTVTNRREPVNIERQAGWPATSCPNAFIYVIL